MNLTYATVPCCLMFLFPNPFAAAASAAENEDDDLKYLSYAVVTACSFIYDDSMSQTGWSWCSCNLSHPLLTMQKKRRDREKRQADVAKSYLKKSLVEVCRSVDT